MSGLPSPRPDPPHPALGVLLWVIAAGVVTFGLWIPGLLYDTPFVLGALQLLIMAYVVFVAIRASLAQKREDRDRINDAHALVKHCGRILRMVDRAVRDMEGIDRTGPLLDRLYDRLDTILVQYRRYLEPGAADVIWDAENSIMDAMASGDRSLRVLVRQLADSLGDIDSMVLDVDSPALRHRRNRV